MVRKQYYNSALYYVQTDIAGPRSRHTSLRRDRGVLVQIWTYPPTSEQEILNGAQFPSRYQGVFLPSPEEECITCRDDIACPRHDEDFTVTYGDDL